MKTQFKIGDKVRRKSGLFNSIWDQKAGSKKNNVFTIKDANGCWISLSGMNHIWNSKYFLLDKAAKVATTVSMKTNNGFTKGSKVHRKVKNRDLDWKCFAKDNFDKTFTVKISNGTFATFEEIDGVWPTEAFTVSKTIKPVKAPFNVGDKVVRCLAEHDGSWSAHVVNSKDVVTVKSCSPNEIEFNEVGMVWHPACFELASVPAPVFKKGDKVVRNFAQYGGWTERDRPLTVKSCSKIAVIFEEIRGGWNPARFDKYVAPVVSAPAAPFKVGDTIVVKYNTSGSYSSFKVLAIADNYKAVAYTAIQGEFLWKNLSKDYTFIEKL